MVADKEGIFQNGKHAWSVPHDGSLEVSYWMKNKFNKKCISKLISNTKRRKYFQRKEQIKKQN
jgi:hypothetical protein